MYVSERWKQRSDAQPRSSLLFHQQRHLSHILWHRCCLDSAYHPPPPSPAPCATTPRTFAIALTCGPLFADSLQQHACRLIRRILRHQSPRECLAQDALPQPVGTFEVGIDFSFNFGETTESLRSVLLFVDLF